MSNSQNQATPSSSGQQALHRVETVSKQKTNVLTVSCKLEWRIYQFEKLTKLYKNGLSLVSQRFFSRHIPSVVWELHIYPSGKRLEDITDVSFFLRQVGMQNAAEPLITDFHIYSMAANLTSRNGICRDIKDFVHQQGRGKFKIPREKMLEFAHPDGSILLFCDVEFLYPEANFGIKQQLCGGMRDPVAAVEHSLRAANREILESELFADCKIQVGKKTFSAHRCILAQQSNVFRSMFSQEGMIEAKNREVVICDSRPEAVRAMLEFMYSGELADFWFDSFAVEILAIADKYGIVPLKEQCEVYLASKITNGNVMEIAVVADTYFAQHLRMACTHHLSANHKRIIRSTAWKELKSSRSELANELLESVLDVKMEEDGCSESDESPVDDVCNNKTDDTMFDGVERKKRRL